jgi:uncharacterized OB-fold protein
MTLALQRCTACGTVQYPPRELCVACLGDALEWWNSETQAGEVLATTTLFHSHAAAFHAQLPLQVGLVRLDVGPSAVCFLAEGCVVGGHVSVTSFVDTEGRTVLRAVPVIAGNTEATKQ